ncbi:hypothetical protein ACGFWD_27025 [Streptomyces sp. NPDC048448]|uniref:hypothetical protein n=1 Tax=Streptomyces sp. NPDC048448 TaxID=3365554 RepID=UPI00371D66FB
MVTEAKHSPWTNDDHSCAPRPCSTTDGDWDRAGTAFPALLDCLEPGWRDI